MLDRRLEHLGERQRAVLGEHHEQAARRARRDGRQRAVLGRVAASPGRGRTSAVAPVGATPSALIAITLLGARIVDQRLRLAAPAERVPHRRGRGEHRAGRVDRVAAALEHHRAGGRRERLAGDRHPVLAVQRRLLGALLRRRDGGGQRGNHVRRRAAPPRAGRGGRGSGAESVIEAFMASSPAVGGDDDAVDGGLQ